MIGFIDAAIGRTRTSLLLMVMVVIAGLFARAAIPIASEPHIVVPFFSVTVVHEGISPEDAERLLVRPIEQEIRSIAGVKEIVSSAQEGRISISLEFQPEIDIDQALLEVRERVDIAKAKLPLMHIVSLNDTVVPPTENTFVLQRRLAPQGHGMTVIVVKEGTEKSSGHHFDHPAVTRAADFIEVGLLQVGGLPTFPGVVGQRVGMVIIACNISVIEIRLQFDCPIEIRIRFFQRRQLR